LAGIAVLQSFNRPVTTGTHVLKNNTASNTKNKKLVDSAIIDWTFSPSAGGTDFPDDYIKIYVNGVLVTNATSTDNGRYNVVAGSTVTVEVALDVNENAIFNIYDAGPGGGTLYDNESAFTFASYTFTAGANHEYDIDVES
jgi:hypothetical protein